MGEGQRASAAAQIGRTLKAWRMASGDAEPDKAEEEAPEDEKEEKDGEEKTEGEAQEEPAPVAAAAIFRRSARRSGRASSAKPRPGNCGGASRFARPVRMDQEEALLRSVEKRLSDMR